MGLASAGGSILLFTAYTLVARLVSKTVMGEYQIISTLMGIALLTVYPKMSGVLIAAGARRIHGAFAEGTAMVIKKSWQGIAVLAFFSLYYALTGAYGLSIAAAIGGLFFTPYAISGLYESYYVGTGDIQRYATRSLTISGALATALIASAYFLPHSAAALVFAFFSTNALTAGLYTYYLAQYPATHTIPGKKEYLEFAKKTSWTEALLQATNYADILLLNAFFGPKDVAIYAIARMIPETIKGFVKNAGTLSVAHVAAMNTTHIKRMLIARTAQATGIAAIVFIAYAASAPLFFPLAFPAYPEALRYSQLLALSFLAFPAHLAESTLGALLRKKETITLNTSAAGAMLIFSCILIPPFGVLGAILARVLARFSNAIVALFITLRSV